MQARYYQLEAIHSLFHYWQHNRGNPLVLLPTATGKSVVIAGFICQSWQWFPGTKIYVLTHVKELISQNFKKLKTMWPAAPAGIYSAGLGRKDKRKPIIFAGVQSMVNALDEIDAPDIVGIDEAHLVSPEDETRYQTVIAAWRKRNPALKVFGTSATGWRRKQGMLTDDGLFTHVCYDRTKPDDFRRFIAEGFLSPLLPRATQTQLDLSTVSLQSGEYNLKQLEAAVDTETTTHSALREICFNGQDRRAWLIFCSGIQHAEHCAQILNSWGIRSGAVHSKLTGGERDEMLASWYSGKLRCVTNNNVLTTGIDYPDIDMIGMLRPTMSSSLWVQMLGRGMRVAPGKNNCLVLDFANNTLRLGPVDDPVIPGKPRPGPPGDAPMKICKHCNTYNYASARYCSYCGADFPVQDKLDSQASTLALMTADVPIIETFKVTNCNYEPHISKVGNHSLKTTYYSGIRAFQEYISIGGSGFGGVRAKQWWQQRSYHTPPDTVEDALSYVSELRVPTAIKVLVNAKYPEILGYEWH